MLLAIVCIAGSCTDEDEYTQGQWMKKASYNGVYRAYASGFTIGNYGYLCGGFYGANKDYLNDLWEYDMKPEQLDAVCRHARCRAQGCRGLCREWQGIHYDRFRKGRLLVLLCSRYLGV